MFPMIKFIIIKIMFFITWFYLSYSFYIKYVNKFKSDPINFTYNNPGKILSFKIKYYLKCYLSRFKNFIFLALNKGRLNYLELFIIVFTFHFFITFIFKMILLMYLKSPMGLIDIINPDVNGLVNSSPFEFSNSMVGEVTSSSSSSSSNPSVSLSTSTNPSASSRPRESSYSNAADSAIMGAAIAGGFTLARHTPGIAQKIATVAGSVIAGGAAIITKNVAGNASENVGKKNYLSLYEELEKFFGLTGDSGLDLLIMINTFQELELGFIYLFCHTFIIFAVPENYISWLETKVLKITTTFEKSLTYKTGFIYNIPEVLVKLPRKLIERYFKYLRIYKKSSLILIICLLILIVICNLYSIYYLKFFIDNYEDILRKFSEMRGFR